MMLSEIPSDHSLEVPNNIVSPSSMTTRTQDGALTEDAVVPSEPGGGLQEDPEWRFPAGAKGGQNTLQHHEALDLPLLDGNWRKHVPGIARPDTQENTLHSEFAYPAPELTALLGACSPDVDHDVLAAILADAQKLLQPDLKPTRAGANKPAGKQDTRVLCSDAEAAAPYALVQGPRHRATKRARPGPPARLDRAFMQEILRVADPVLSMPLDINSFDGF